ncbi:MAG TPA: MFS transporter, partial [Planctomycetaceae bacterium]|nr:MFS transporter [Planctomycetaceae bacterium]
MITVRLAIMMFLQFFVWGAWYVSVTGFLKAHEMEAVTGAVYTLGPIAAIVAPFFLGIIADRFFATERVLAVLHILGGIVLCLAPGFAEAFKLKELPANASLFYAVVMHDRDAYVQPMVLMLLLHMLFFMPTLALTTSLAFHNLDNQEKEFPIVRVLGTIGWIVGNIAVSFLPGKDTSAGQFYLAGGAAVLLGLYSLTLPHTPPPLRGKTPSLGQILGTDSFRLFRSFPYTVFIIASFLICIPLAGYYSFARMFVDDAGALVNGSATFTMSFGQMSEVIFMILMPVFFARLGVKWMLAVGMGAWALRYGLFMMGADDQVFWMIL